MDSLAKIHNYNVRFVINNDEEKHFINVIGHEYIMAYVQCILVRLMQIVILMTAPQHLLRTSV